MMPGSVFNISPQISLAARRPSDLPLFRCQDDYRFSNESGLAYSPAALPPATYDAV